MKPMSFLEIKGMLARLLAQENLVVEHDPSSRTASFNVETRVMTLPVWETDNEQVYNLFVSHEVGHALFTPSDFPERLQKAGVNAGLVNVIEDVRVEKLMQQKFPGLRRDYSIGYRELFESGLFGVRHEDIKDLNFVDRLNIHYKVGAQLLVPFSDEERELLDEVYACKDYDTVVEVSDKVQSYLIDLENRTLRGDLTTRGPGLEKPDAESLYKGFAGGVYGGSASAPDLRSEEEAELDRQNERESINNRQPEEKPPASQDSEEEEEDLKDFKSETQEALDEGIAGMLVAPSFHRQITYLKTPTFKVSDVVWPLKELRAAMSPTVVEDLINDHQADEKFRQFLVSARKDVNHMVQIFEMRKSAEVYSRVQVNKTGMLDTSKLHNYRLTDDIFLRQETTPDGKSHGMVMLLDWSGSMDKVAFDTIKQILVLTQFCRKLGIPFRVYTFTNGNTYKEINGNSYMHQPSPRAQIVEVLNSSVKKSDLDKDMFNLYLIGFGKSVSGPYGKNMNPNSIMQMGGTPLINTMLFGLRLLDKFKEETGVDKTSFIVLTDGESSRMTYFSNKGSHDAHYVGPILIRGEDASVYKLDEDYRLCPGSIARWITCIRPNVSVTNIFLGPFSICSNYHRTITGFSMSDEHKPIKKIDFTRNNGLHFTTRDNWPLVALMNPQSFDGSSAEIELGEASTPGRIRSSFKKFLGKKSGSKKVLGAIVESFA